MPLLALLSDALLIAGTAALAIWCRTLAKRLRATEGADPGTAPDVRSETIDRLEGRLAELEAAIAASSSLVADRAAMTEDANRRADDRIGRMEMLLASLEGLEEEHADRVLQDAERQIRAEPTATVERLPSFRAARHAASGGRF